MTDCSLYLVRIPLAHILLSNAGEYSNVSETNLYVNYVSF